MVRLNFQKHLMMCAMAPPLMITSKMFRANHPSRVPILLSTPEGQQSELLTDSVVVTDNLATIAESAIDRVIGSVPMTKVDIALRHTLNL